MSWKSVKVVCVVLLLMACLTALVGCGAKKEGTVSDKKDDSPATTSTTSESNKADKPLEITYWNGFTGPDGPVLEELVKKFNETNGKIVIKMDIMPWDSLRQKLASTLAVGQGPDIIAFHTENIGTYAKPGMVAELDDLYGPDGIDINVIPKALAENLQYNGRFYGAPMNFATLMLYYNKDLFKDAGLDPEKPPKNWDELKDYAIKLTKVSNGTVEQYGFGVATRETIPMWPILIWGNGGDLIDIANKKAVINNEKSIEAVQIWSDLIKNYDISPPTMTGAEVDKLFESQKCAMYMCGPWAVNACICVDPGLLTDLKVQESISVLPLFLRVLQVKLL